ncbi:hypothetical protein AB6E77_01665 [Vibrio sp. 10N.247.311.18]|uniref:hypothetical protein n=1 Tax=unclassified Vibrio TaxID=2614977 RepID=UPI00355169C1
MQEGNQEVKSVCAAGGCRKKPKGKSKYCGDTCKKKASRSKTKKAKSKSQTKAKLTCSNCPNPISYGNKSGLCKSCKDLERIEHRKANLYLCTISEWLIHHAVRHGTVEVLPRDKDGMVALLKLRSFALKANGLTFKKDTWELDNSKRCYHICHRFPLKAEGGRIGLFVRDNLVLAPASLNLKMGNAIGCENGLWLDPTNLDPKFKVYKGMGGERIFNLIAEWCPYIVEHLMQKTKDGAYRFSIVRNRNKPTKQPKDIAGLYDYDVFDHECIESFGNTISLNDYYHGLEGYIYDQGFMHLLTTPASPKDVREIDVEDDLEHLF